MIDLDMKMEFSLSAYILGHKLLSVAPSVVFVSIDEGLMAMHKPCIHGWLLVDLQEAHRPHHHLECGCQVAVALVPQIRIANLLPHS